MALIQINDLVRASVNSILMGENLFRNPTGFTDKASSSGH
jgi:hypothetical protein